MKSGQNIGVIIQARTGSSRLPRKMVLPFADSSIVRIIVSRLSKRLSDVKLILATTTNSGDDELVDQVSDLDCLIFRGDENDVLDRFINAAKFYDVDYVVRICADNPFLLTEYIHELIENFQPEMDYLSYSFDGTKPVIKNHIGIFGEMISLKTLEKVNEMTSDKFYHEHVTNFIYESGDEFNVNLLPVPDRIAGRENIRLTVDTKADFDLGESLYRKIGEENLNLENLMDEVESNSEYLEIMRNEIMKNSK